MSFDCDLARTPTPDPRSETVRNVGSGAIKLAASHVAIPLFVHPSLPPPPLAGRGPRISSFVPQRIVNSSERQFASIREERGLELRANVGFNRAVNRVAMAKSVRTFVLNVGLTVPLRTCRTVEPPLRLD